MNISEHEQDKNVFQQSFLSDAIASGSSGACLKYFTGDSLLVDNEMVTLMGTAKKPQPTRKTKVGDAVDVYRNLNRQDLFSIKQRYGANKGKVSGYARSVVIKYPSFAIGEKSRLRVLEKGNSRNVHAFVRGEFKNGINGDILVDKLSDYLRVSYSPYVSGSFYSLDRDIEGKLIKSSIKPFNTPEQYRYAIINGADVILTNDEIA